MHCTSGVAHGRRAFILTKSPCTLIDDERRRRKATGRRDFISFHGIIKVRCGLCVNESEGGGGAHGME